MVVKKANTKTRFCSVTIEDPETCHKVSAPSSPDPRCPPQYFGKYYHGGETILCCETQRNSCLPYIVM